MADVFGRAAINIVQPITADNALIDWGGVVTNCQQVSISAAQPINRRHTIGNRKAVIWSGQMAGQINIARIMTVDVTDLYSAPGFSVCDPGTISVTFGDCGESGGGAITYTATGCLVSNLGVQAEAEGLQVVDNVTIEFLQLFFS
jgi:hypothetical protein